MMKLNIRNIAKKIHLLIGLSTGIIVFIICITGCIYAFQKEIRLATAPYYKIAEVPQNQQKMKLSEQLANYQEQQKTTTVLRVYDFKPADRNTLFLVLKNNAYFFAFINPYTGELIKEKALAQDFFYIVLYIHMNLLLGGIGSAIVKWSVLLFFITLLTGIILWLPKNKKMLFRKKGLKSKLIIQKTSNSYVRNYQWHSVLGIYAVSVLIVISLTGLAWSFSWVDEMLYTAVNFEQPVEEDNEVVIEESTLDLTVLDEQQKKIATAFPNKELALYYLPQDETTPLNVNVIASDGCFANSDEFSVHPQTGAVLKTIAYQEKNRGEKLRDMYYDLHTGSIGGVVGKIIAFLASLIGATLPLTGFLMWRKRRKKKR